MKIYLQQPGNHFKKVFEEFQVFAGEQLFSVVVVVVVVVAAAVGVAAAVVVDAAAAVVDDPAILDAAVLVTHSLLFFRN